MCGLSQQLGLHTVAASPPPPSPDMAAVTWLLLHPSPKQSALPLGRWKLLWCRFWAWRRKQLLPSDGGLLGWGGERVVQGKVGWVPGGVLACHTSLWLQAWLSLPLFTNTYCHIKSVLTERGFLFVENNYYRRTVCCHVMRMNN